MRYLKLFEYYNSYYFPVDQDEFDHYLQRDELFCFTDEEMKKISNFLKDYKIDHYFLSATLYFMSDSDGGHFWLCDNGGMDKTLEYESIIVHSNDKKIHRVLKSLTEDSNLPNRIYGNEERGEADREYTLVNFSLNIQPLGSSIWIAKSFDDWFLFCGSNEIDMYKCDQMDGLFHLLSEELNRYKG